MCCTFLINKTWLIHLSQNQSIFEMIQTPVIVTFANQKGGVGKTTLCITFANYLVTKGVKVVVIDCDFQHSIMKCRKADIRKYGEQEMPYEVWAYEANDKAMMTSLMEKLHNDPEIDIVLMDTPRRSSSTCGPCTTRPASRCPPRSSTASSPRRTIWRLTPTCASCRSA